METRRTSQNEQNNTLSHHDHSENVSKLSIPLNNQSMAGVPSCSSYFSNVFSSNYEQARENISSSSTSVPASSTEGLSNLRWAIVANNIFSTPQRLTRSCKQSGYIYKQLKIMYVMCCSALRVTETEASHNPGDKREWLLHKLQLILFLTVAILSSLRSFSDAKYALLWFLFGGGLNWVVKLTYSLTSLVTTLCATWILCKNSKQSTTMINSIFQYERHIKTKNKWHYLPTILAIVTTVLALLRSVLVVDLEELSVEKVILLLSYQISEDTFLWKSANLNISSKVLLEEYGTQLNFATVTLSAIKFTNDFGFNLQQGLVWDLLLTVALTLQFWMNLFVESVKNVSDNISDDLSEERRQLGQNRNVVWKMYKDIQGAFEAVNDVFEPLILCFHITNILRYALFLERCICSQSVTLIIFIQILYDIVKSEIIYTVASNMTHQNKVVRKWLRNWSIRTGKIQLANMEMDINVVLDELTDEPLGLGRNDFVIQSGLHLKVLGLTGSLFLLLANKT